MISKVAYTMADNNLENALVDEKLAKSMQKTVFEASKSSFFFQNRKNLRH